MAPEIHYFLIEFQCVVWCTSALMIVLPLRTATKSLAQFYFIHVSVDAPTKLMFRGPRNVFISVVLSLLIVRESLMVSGGASLN